MPAPTLKQAREDPAVNSARATISDLDREIRELSRVVCPGGAVYWRSAAKEPWYRQRFEKMGFKTERLQVRESGKSIDVSSRTSCSAGPGEKPGLTSLLFRTLAAGQHVRFALEGDAHVVTSSRRGGESWARRRRCQLG